MTEPIIRPKGIAVSYNMYNIATIDDVITTVLTDSNRDFKPVLSIDGRHLVFSG